MHKLTYLSIVLFSLWLSGCSTAVKETTLPLQNKIVPTPAEPTLAASQIHDWNIEGKIAIRNESKNNSGSANLKWQQHKSNYSMLFYGPMGAGTQKLTGGPGKVVLEMADGKKVIAKSPEALLASQTGWRLPVSSLYYWIRGLPVPSIPSDKKFDNTNHLSQLKQQGWMIQYLHYTNVRQVDLPSKILLVNPEMNVKIIINQWNI